MQKLRTDIIHHLHLHFITTTTVVCLTTRPLPLPIQSLQRVRSSASSFNFQVLLFCVMSSSSCLVHNNKLKFTLEQPIKDQGRTKGISTLSLTSALDGVGGHRNAPTPLIPGKTRHALYRGMGGPRALSGRCGKSRPHWNSFTRTFQPVTIRYTG
jgi:hypothetical protein